MLDRFVAELSFDKDYKDTVVYSHAIPERPAKSANLKTRLPAELGDALRNSGVRALYSHQAEAIEAVRAGKNVVITTPTASGKTLCYNLPKAKFFGLSQIMQWPRNLLSVTVIVISV